MVELMRAIRLNNNRIEALVDEIYGLNRLMIGLEGQLLRICQKAGVTREEFLQRYYGQELDPNWFQQLGRLTGQGLEELPRRPQGRRQDHPQRHLRWWRTACTCRSATSAASST